MRLVSKSIVGGRISPEAHDYILNHVVARIPLVNARMRAYDLLGVRLSDWRDSMIMLGAEIHAPRLLRIGHRVIVGAATLDARGHITIGDDVNIGGGAILQTGTHLVDSPTFAAAFAPIIVGSHVWIAQRAMVLGGVTIGDGAVVAAGAVVTRDVDPYIVVGGVPARELRARPRGLDYRLRFRGDLL